MCLRLCACVCESRYAWVFTHVEDIGYFYLSLRLGFSKTWNLPMKQNWLASKPSEICPFLLPHTGIMSLRTTPMCSQCDFF